MTARTLAYDSGHQRDCSGCPACSHEMAYLLAHSDQPRPSVERQGRRLQQHEFRVSGERTAAREGVPPPPNLNAAIRALRGIPEPRMAAHELPVAETSVAIRRAETRKSEGQVPPPPDLNAAIRAARSRA